MSVPDPNVAGESRPGPHAVGPHGPAPADPSTAAAGGGAAVGDSLATLVCAGWVSYILHLMVAVGAMVPGAQVGLVLLVIAGVLDWVKSEEAAGTWLASHFAWRIRSVLIAGVLYVLTLPLFLLFYFPGALAWALISVWFLYRIVKGMVRMNVQRPVA